MALLELWTQASSRLFASLRTATHGRLFHAFFYTRKEIEKVCKNWWLNRISKFYEHLIKLYTKQPLSWKIVPWGKKINLKMFFKKKVTIDLNSSTLIACNHIFFQEREDYLTTYASVLLFVVLPNHHKKKSNRWKFYVA